MAFYQRKNTRLTGYDYHTENYYFITICTHNKNCIFGEPKKLNDVGKISEECILKIQVFYPHVRVDNYVVMPNHIHIILALEGTDQGFILPDISEVIGQYKMSVTKKVRKLYPDMNVWQRSFHDHIIRNQSEYEKIWNYVEYNDQKWNEDRYYIIED